MFDGKSIMEMGEGIIWKCIVEYFRYGIVQSVVLPLARFDMCPPHFTNYWYSHVGNLCYPISEALHTHVSKTSLCCPHWQFCRLGDALRLPVCLRHQHCLAARANIFWLTLASSSRLTFSLPANYESLGQYLAIRISSTWHCVFLIRCYTPHSLLHIIKHEMNATSPKITHTFVVRRFSRTTFHLSFTSNQ